MDIWMTLLESLFSSAVTAPAFARIRVGIRGRICGGLCPLTSSPAMPVSSGGFGRTLGSGAVDYFDRRDAEAVKR